MTIPASRTAFATPSASSTPCGTRKRTRTPASSRRWLWQSRSSRTRSRAPTPSTAPTRRSSRHTKTPATASWCLPCYLPGRNGLYKTDALFVIYPSQRGGWSAQCVTDHKTKKPKLPFPQSWAGQPQEVIEQKSGIEGISFCHASRFLITAKDKETALAACRQVLKNNGRI